MARNPHRVITRTLPLTTPWRLLDVATGASASTRAVVNQRATDSF